LRRFNYLYSLMSKKHVLRKDLAHMTHIPERTLAHYIAGDAEPGVYRALKIARALNVNVERIWG
jgi:DNA-binding XRE family transcriptional regulator